MKLRENRAGSHSLKAVAYDNVQVFRHNIIQIYKNGTLI